VTVRGASGLRKARLDTPERQKEIFAAVLAVLAEVGYARFNMQQVAARAKVSTATLYQRWPSKSRLIVDALTSVQPQFAQPDLGSFTADVRAIMNSWSSDPEPGACACDMRGVVLGLLEGSRQDSELAQLRSKHITGVYEGPLRRALAEAVERGEVPRTLDHDLLVRTLIWNYVLHPEAPSIQASVIVDRIVDGLLAPLLSDHRRR
jgi:AcrR family transcriptional regulator